MGTKIANSSEKLLKDTLSMIESDDKEIATSFYNKR